MFDEYVVIPSRLVNNVTNGSVPVLRLKRGENQINNGLGSVNHFLVQAFQDGDDELARVIMDQMPYHEVVETFTMPPVGEGRRRRKPWVTDEMITAVELRYLCEFPETT